MANLSEDIQCAGSDTRPLMLDRIDFASWQQRIQLYCRGKENGVNILKSIDEGPFKMGTLREILTKGTEGLSFIMFRVDRIEDSGTMHGVQVQLVMRELGTELDEEQLLFIACGQDNIVDEDVDEKPVQDLALNVDNVFQVHNCDAFDSDPTQHISITIQNNVVDKSMTAKLATYKEQVELNERRARFEITESEQNIDEQLRIVITDRNIKEENLNKELHSVKMQLASTINHNKSMVEEVTSLKKDFKQKENKYLEEFVDMKALKEKPALYNGHEIIKTDHVPAIVHSSEDTLEIAEINRKKMNEKIKTPLWTHNKINIRPPDYSKENFLSTFTPQTQLTPEQIFWSKDVLKMKTEALKEQAKAAKPVKALMVYPPNTSVKLVPGVLPTKNSVTPKVLAPGMHAIDVEPIPPRLRNNREVHLDYLKHLKESVETLREIVEKAKVERPLDISLASACLYTKHSQELLEYVVKIVLWYLDPFCSKHMTGDRSRLRNFVKKFIGTVRFRNDHFGTIMGYEDYVIGDSVISRVYYVEGLGHNLFSVRKFYDSNLKVAFRKHSCYVQDTDGVELIKGFRGSNLYTISVEYMMNKYLGKLQQTTDVRIFVSYAPSRKGYRIYNKRTRRMMETIHVQFDEVFEPMASDDNTSGPTPQRKEMCTLHSGLIPQPPSPTPNLSPTKNDSDTVFCSGESSSLFDFDEVMNNNHNQEPPRHNGPPPMVRPNGQAPRTMEELCQQSINGRGGPIAPIPIQATDFSLPNHMIRQVQNTCQFHGLPGDDANRHIDKFLEITQHMKQNGVSDDALRLSLFLYSLTHHAIASDGFMIDGVVLKWLWRQL
nr:integrase, catalytic region, zinc finger, CCHC-type, peptidase aspartic, catalytic [Tanacetum cinerariifolium]